jgi:hypothetical protein
MENAGLVAGRIHQAARLAAGLRFRTPEATALAIVEHCHALGLPLLYIRLAAFARVAEG